MFGIITKPNIKKIEFAKRLGLRRLIIMSEFFASGKSLIDFANCGISLEVGPHNRFENVDEIKKTLINFYENKNYNFDLEIFEVFYIVKKKYANISINNFEEVKTGQIITFEEGFKQLAEFDFVSVLVGEQAYGDVLCLACKKIDSDNLYKSDKLD